MDKIAVISDVHGNLEALKTVLSDIKERGIDKIYCLGDVIGKGANSNECLNRLKDSVMVYGNWEDFLNNKICSSNEALKKYDWLYNHISEDNKKRLRALPLCYEVYISGRLVRMFHATPGDPWTNVLRISRLDRLYQLFLPTENTSDKKADIVLHGHIHTQDLMRFYNRTLINVGSVGNAFDIIRNKEKDASFQNSTNAEYLIIEGVLGSEDYSDIRFEFVSLKYDIEKELAGSKDILDFDTLSKELLNAEYRDVDKYKECFKESFYDIEDL